MTRPHVLQYKNQYTKLQRINLFSSDQLKFLSPSFSKYVSEIIFPYSHLVLFPSRTLQSPDQ